MFRYLPQYKALVREIHCYAIRGLDSIPNKYTRRLRLWVEQLLYALQIA